VSKGVEKNGQKAKRRGRVYPRSFAEIKKELGSGLGLAQAGDAFPVFPLATLLQYLQALKTLKHIPLATQGGGRTQTTML
jgi:hypothetical protein